MDYIKILKIVNLVIVTLLSITAGASKIELSPQEIEFFNNVGLSGPVVMSFAILQIIGGALLILKKVRKWGAMLVALMFGISTIEVFMNGMIAFGFFSILPIAMAGIIIKDN